MSRRTPSPTRARIASVTCCSHSPASGPPVTCSSSLLVNGAGGATGGLPVSPLRAVRDRGRLATITSDPPEPERGIGIASVYVRPDAAQLELAAAELAAGRLEFTVGARFPLADAGAALTRAVAASAEGLARNVNGCSGSHAVR